MALFMWNIFASCCRGPTRNDILLDMIQHFGQKQISTFTHSFIPSFIHSFIHSFILHSFIHSLTFYASAFCSVPRKSLTMTINNTFPCIHRKQQLSLSTSINKTHKKQQTKLFKICSNFIEASEIKAILHTYRCIYWTCTDSFHNIGTERVFCSFLSPYQTNLRSSQE